jgi:predicted outer membrane lipoprotein
VAHRGNLEEGGILWTSTFYGVESTLPSRVHLAVPLPAATELRSSHVQGLRDSSGRVEALVFDAHTSPTVHLWQPAWQAGIAPPLAADPVLQRVILDDGRFAPDPSLQLEKHTRYWAPASMSRSERAAIDGLAGRARTRDQALYLVADNRLTAAGGLIGEVGLRGQVAGSFVWVLGALFAAAMGALALLYRGLSTVARREQNAAYIHGMGQREAGPSDVTLER